MKKEGKEKEKKTMIEEYLIAFCRHLDTVAAGAETEPEAENLRQTTIS